MSPIDALIGKSRQLLKCVLASGCACLSFTASAASDEVNRLADLSIEQLMDETVTSVSKREERLGDAATAISVLSHDDLQRAGVTSVVDALRLVPGLQVASSNGSLWAVSARGFNQVYANKLLVMVDGRAVYLPTFAGVYWALQQVMIEDVERIEVIRGPGATLWGANAVNGVINIVTRSAQQTQGGLVYGGGGSLINNMAGVRYGDSAGDDTFFRISSSHFDQRHHLLENNQSAGDAWRVDQGSLRVDHYAGRDSHLSWQAGATKSIAENDRSIDSNFNTVGRWEKRYTDNSNIDIQAYYDRTDAQLSLIRDRTDVLDVALHQTFSLNKRDDVIWGAGYRHVHNELQAGLIASVLQPTFNGQLLSAFIQDEKRVIPNKLSVTIGVKWEHNDLTGSEWQPSIRAAYKASDKTTLWSAASRAVRIPDIVEATRAFYVYYGAPVQGPDGGYYLPAITGNPSIKSEVLNAYEVGYRAQLSDRFSLDATAFYNDYNRIITPSKPERMVPGVPYGVVEVPWANTINATTKGTELSATFAPTDDWRLTANYSMLTVSAAGPAYATPEGLEDSSPRHQASLRAAYDLNAQWSFDLTARYVGAITQVSAYTTADAHVAYRPTARLDVSLVGRNLLQRTHAEQAAIFPFLAAEVPRSVYIKTSWHF